MLQMYQSFPRPGHMPIPAFKFPNPAYPPPNIPPGYATNLYPVENLDPNDLPAIQMEDISRNRKSNETCSFTNSKISNYGNQRLKHKDDKYYCSICSEYPSPMIPNGKVIRHRHNSSKFMRIYSTPLRWGEYNCITCKISPHSHKTGVRHPVIVTSSILNNWQGKNNGYPGDDIHVDMIGIPGATIKMLHHAFMAEFKDSYRPVDVLLVGGLNDVMRGRPLDKIMKDLVNFKRDVINLERSFANNGECTFAAATLPYPPKISALPAEEREIQTNRFETLSKITDFIREMNRNNVSTDPTPRGSYNAPTYHTWGMKTTHADPNVYGPRNRMESMVGYRQPQWREEKYEEMVHLDNKSRLRMGKAAIKYFMVLYDIIKCKADSKVKGLEIEKRKFDNETCFSKKRKLH